MTRVNLLPPELRQRQRARRQSVLVAVAGVAILAVMAFIYFLQVLRLHDVDHKLAEQEARNAQLQGQVARLQKFAQIRQELQTRQKLVRGVLSDTVRWSGVLRDVSLVLPTRMWLTSMSGTITAPGVGAAVGTTIPATPGQANLIGNIQFQGNSLDKPTIALWLTRLEEVHGWVNAWLSTAQESTIGTTGVVTFSSSVDLTKAAATQGGQL